VSGIGTVATATRYALGAIRLVNGVLGLLAPAVIIRRFGDDVPDRHPDGADRADLIRPRGRDLDHAVRVAPLIHASDTATVLALWRSKQLSTELARPLLLISGTNTALAVTAFLASRRSRT
jgi:hypothetical protein